MQVDSLDNISNKVLDTLRDKYKDDPNIRINDDRKSLSFGKSREYFLISKDTADIRDVESLEWTFIWIGSNLWQYRFLNVHCNTKQGWVDPLELLNSLL
jgi:hypothetical protein